MRARHRRVDICANVGVQKFDVWSMSLSLFFWLLCIQMNWYCFWLGRFVGVISKVFSWSGFSLFYLLVIRLINNSSQQIVSCFLLCVKSPAEFEHDKCLGCVCMWHYPVQMVFWIVILVIVCIDMVGYLPRTSRSSPLLSTGVVGASQPSFAIASVAPTLSETSSVTQASSSAAVPPPRTQHRSRYLPDKEAEGTKNAAATEIADNKKEGVCFIQQ